MLSAVPMAGAFAALAACGQTEGGSGAKGGSLGPKRTVAWAVGTTGSDFVTEISVGAADAAAMLGWRFNRILNALPTPDAHINAIRTAVTARSDVILTVDWYQAVVDEIAAGQKQGTHFAVVNSANNPDELAPLNVPFVGQEPRTTGRLMGERIAAALAKKDIRQGSVLVGNPFPGSLNIEERIRGIGEGLASADGGLEMVTFPDSAAADSTLSVGLYKAKITEIGNVVAHAVAGSEMSAVPLTKALAELQTGPGQVVVGSWVSSLKTLNLVKSGQITFALDENLYYQGFMAVLLVWSMLERQMPASTLSSGHTWVSADNVEEMIASYNRRKVAAEAYGLS
ncbi:substrate-binding domain-containing protein [Novosphingobium mangrovi (ex Huang et al. 2023)]|uniref:Substrate-binding domain-containing protein n=1 Tax=Novosphingobium mangrovi (ex Huang et al. 2023) TaxID=2976432 RepID=A0ABT2I1X2_9SPHN|nr:substrate-binding domain-containing protein [Novosphingobium mangrovi (ex Huang et al. 2023)]MCT2398794.1 substrate-binding domain-containing protein [Novosphingobium mangrovi (ex Huang et al. 2023)]